MTRRMSQRARAREIYREMTQAKKATPTPDPSPQGGGETKLTARVRALYENSAVPVREIARLAGVTERTLYKYARKGGWSPRYAFLDRGGVARRRLTKETAARVAPDPFAPVKGAGGRFVARAEKGKSFARGIKATDPVGAARASAVCAQAEAVAAAARAEAEWFTWHETFLVCLRTVRTIGDELAAYCAERRGREAGPGTREQTLNRVGQLALDYLSFCQQRIAVLPVPGAVLPVTSRQRFSIGKS